MCRSGDGCGKKGTLPDGQRGIYFPLLGTFAHALGDLAILPLPLSQTARHVLGPCSVRRHFGVVPSPIPVRHSPSGKYVRGCDLLTWWKCFHHLSCAVVRACEGATDTRSAARQRTTAVCRRACVRGCDGCCVHTQFKTARASRARLVPVRSSDLYRLS